MKRLIAAWLAIGLLAGIAISAQRLFNRAPAPAAQINATALTGASNGSDPFASIPEQLSIVLSSLVLLGSTTLLRRRRRANNPVEANYADTKFASFHPAVDSR
jgi:hypothetical protein